MSSQRLQNPLISANPRAGGSSQAPDASGLRSGLQIFLIGTALLGYLTSFLREAYLLRAALGSDALDKAVLAYAIAGLLGNLYAVTLGLVWIDGRPIPAIWTHFGIFAAIGLALTIVWPIGGSCLLLASLVAGFEYNRQRSAFVSRQALVLMVALLAPAASIACWTLYGVGSLQAIIVGYSAGFFVQSSAAALLARTAKPVGSDRLGTHKAVSLMWPIMFAAFTQVNGLLDRFVLAFAEHGWVGAASFAQNLASAAMLIVVGPLSSEAVAGRIRKQPSPRLIAAIMIATGTAIVLTPTLLPLVVYGGSVTGQNYVRVEQLIMLYLLGVPAAGYWLFRARAMQDHAARWRAIAFTAGLSSAAHVVISVIAMATGHPLFVPAGWVLAAYLGAALVTRGDKLERPRQRL